MDLLQKNKTKQQKDVWMHAHVFAYPVVHLVDTIH